MPERSKFEVSCTVDSSMFDDAMMLPHEMVVSEIGCCALVLQPSSSTD